MNSNFTFNASEIEYKEDYHILEIIRRFKAEYPLEVWTKFGIFHEDYIKTINIHWLQFSPPREINHYSLAVLYAVIMSSGWCRTLRTPANFLVANLAVSDLLMMSKMSIFIFNSFCRGPALGKIGCQIYGFVGGLTGTVSIATLGAISIDRYYVIKFPLNVRFTRMRAKICVVFVWFYGALFAAVPLLNLKLGSYVPEGYLTSCSFDYLSHDHLVRAFIFVFFVAAWVLPFFIVLFCYVNILQSALSMKKLTRKDSESSRHIKSSAKKREHELKLAITIFCVVVLWFVAWTPYAIVALLGISNRSDLITPLGSMIPALFCKIASCIDPFLYAITNSKFKGEVKKLLRIGLARRRKTRWTRRDTELSFVTTRRQLGQVCNYSPSCQVSEHVWEEYIQVPITDVNRTSPCSIVVADVVEERVCP